MIPLADDAPAAGAAAGAAGFAPEATHDLISIVRLYYFSSDTGAI
jgi:hypothetical protein